jgi:hypothetical protein
MKKGKLPPSKVAALSMRSVSLVADSASVEARSVKVAVATEYPVMRYFDEYGMALPEVLAMSGIEMRPTHNQLPIVDSHNQSSVRNVLGSVRNLQVVNGELLGDAYFASDEDSQTAYQKLIEGHLTDFSITAHILESVELKRGDSYALEGGNIVAGPAIIHTRWQPTDASLVACGADSYSTVRRSYQVQEERRRAMSEDLLTKLQALGLPEGITEPDQIAMWMLGKLQPTDEVPEEAAPVMPLTPEAEDAAVADVMESMMPQDSEKAERASEEEMAKRSVEAERLRVRTIKNDCKLYGVERQLADELCDSGCSVEVARERILKTMASDPVGSSVKVTESADDKLATAMSDGLVLRSMSNIHRRGKYDPFDGKKPAAGGEDFASLDLYRVAEAFLARTNAPIHRMSKRDVAMAAMGHRPTMERYRIERSGIYNTTGSFANLLLDASKKSLLAGYVEAQYTWNIWARQAPSTNDFKAINRIRFSEIPNLEAVPEVQPYPEVSLTDSKESYQVEKYGSKFSVSWETVVNDDLDAMSRIPQMQGVAARRLQNAKVYEVLTSNPTMNDSNALFSASHASGSNTSGSAAAPSVTTLNNGFKAMMTQTGMTAGTVIAVEPRYIIVPANYRATTLQLLGSSADPVVGGSAAGNSNTLNIYGPNGPSNGLTAVVEPLLDLSSTTNWYLAADPSQIDTVELCFLSGEESPVLESEWDFDKDAWIFKIRQTFGVKAIDWRGLYRNAA